MYGCHGHFVSLGHYTLKFQLYPAFTIGAVACHPQYSRTGRAPTQRRPALANSRALYRPFQTGSRFSAKARAPSIWSSEE